MPYRVMIVDDEQVSQDYLRSLIPWAKKGFALLEPVYSAAQAKKGLKAGGVDIVIFDISMPGESGVSLSAHIAQEYPQVLMLAVSSHDDYDFVRQVLKNGAHDYVLKHRLNAKILEDTLQAMLQNKKRPERGEQNEPDEGALSKWLFSSGRYPFSEHKACAAMVARVPQLGQVNKKMRGSVVSGILSLIRKEGQGIAELHPVYYPPDFFISVYLFSDTVSQHKILGNMFLCKQNAKESILQIYKMDYVGSDYPILCEQEKMPAHIVSAIGMLHEKKVNDAEKRLPVTLSLHNKRWFITAIEEKNAAEAKYLAEAAFAEIDTGDLSAKLSVTNEFLDMLRSAVQEHHCKLQIDKTELLRQAQTQTAEEVVRGIQKLIEETLTAAGAIPKVRSPYIKRTLELIDAHYADDFSQDDAAAQVGLSPAYFSKLFKQETGTNFIETLNRRRIDAAKLLLNTGNNIKGTARLCGFKRYNYFITVFKQYVGTTPAEYVKKQ